MKTKISAAVKGVIREGNKTALLLILETPFTASLDKDAKVYLELTDAITGSKIEFIESLDSAPQPESVEEKEEEKEEEKPQVEELDLPVEEKLTELQPAATPEVTEEEKPVEPVVGEGLPDAPPEISPSITPES